MIQKFPVSSCDAPYLSVISHSDCLFHEPYDIEHPDVPKRLTSIWTELPKLYETLRISGIQPVAAKVDAIREVHESEYLTRLESTCLSGKAWFMSSDCLICEDTFRAVRASAGCSVMSGQMLLRNQPNFVLVRPPGHHAGPQKAEGFCFINHIAIAIHQIRKEEKNAKILVVDIDVHHGNGIDAFFDQDPNVFYFSIHGSPAHIYPYSGHEAEIGIGEGVGYTQNTTVPIGASANDWMSLFHSGLKEIEAKFRPDYVLVAAGFDAHTHDPYGLMQLEDEHYYEMAKTLWELSQKYCPQKMAWFLEGGYSPLVLGRVIPNLIKKWTEANQYQKWK